MTSTPKHDLAYLSASQAQKEVTVNENMARLDALVHLSVKDRDLATAPASPADGDAYIVAASATGDWAGEEGNVAYFDQVWRFISPRAGMLAWVEDELAYVHFHNGAWATLGASSAAVGHARKDLANAKKLVTVGDSITNNGYNIYDGMIGLHQRGMHTWMQILLGFPFNHEVGFEGGVEVGHNAGVGGDSTTDMLARFDADVVAKNPDLVLFMGGTNDITANASAATMTANIQAMAEKTLAVGAHIILCTILPRSSMNATLYGLSDNNYSASQARTMHAVNQWLREYAQQTEGVMLLDTAAVLIDGASANGDAVDALTIDGLHPSPQGGFLLGKAAYELLKEHIVAPALLPIAPNDLYDATDHPYGNIVPNPMMEGTSGSVGTAASGTVANSFKVERTSGTDASAVCSKVARSDGLAGEWQQITYSVGGTGSGTGLMRLRTSPTTLTDVVDGEYYEALCEIEVDAPASGNAILQGLYLQLWDQSGTRPTARCLNAAYDYTLPSPDATLPLSTQSWKGVLRTPALKITGTSGIRLYLVADLDESLTDSVTIRVSRITLRRRQSAPDFG